MIDLELTNVDDADFYQAPMDIDFDALGALATLSGVFLLNQRITKALLTVRKDTNVNPNLGSLFPLLVGEKLGMGLTRGFFVQEIELVINFLRIQESQEPRFTSDERTRLLDEIIIEQIEGNRTRFFITIMITTEAGSQPEIFISPALIPIS